MNTLRWARATVAALGVVVVFAAPAAGFGASPVAVGESSQSTIWVCTTQQPTFSASGTSPLTVSFSAPVNSVANDCSSQWTTTMTISAGVDVPSGTYSFELAVSGASGTLLLDTVTVEVLGPPPTTSSTTTTTTQPPPTTTTTTTTTAAPQTTTTTTTTTTVPATTSTTSTTSAPTTTAVPPTTLPPSTEPPVTTTATTAPPSNAVAAPAAPDGPPGAVLNSDDAPPLGVILPVAAVALALLGWLAVARARRRQITPARDGVFRELGGGSS